MFRKIVSMLIFLLSVVNVFGNIRYIRFSTFPKLEEYEEDVLYIINHRYYMENWVPEWQYDVSKEELTGRVSDIFSSLSVLFDAHRDNIDLCLFLGDVAHFLHNLDAEGDYFSIANEYYEKAREIESRDYRSYWFQGYHLVQSAKPVEGMEKFLFCETAVPPLKLPPHFWQEYAVSAYQAQMIFHVRKAIAYYKGVNDEKEISDTVKMLEDTMDGTIVSADTESLITEEENWIRIPGDSGLNATSYLFGSRLQIPNNWESAFHDVKNGFCAVALHPPRYEGNNSAMVGATVLMLMQVKKEASVEEFARGLLKESYEITEYPVDIGQPDILSYLIEAEDMYKAQGGGKMFLIAFEKDSPEFPGIQLEVPRKFKSTQKSGPSYFTLNKMYERYSGPIFYAFLLDSSESIFEEAFDDYISFIKENVTIE